MRSSRNLKPGIPLALAFPLAFALFGALGLCLMSQARAAEGTSYFKFEGKRSTKLDFDGDYIESMNKRPLDSATALEEADRRRRNIHLYHKRAGFGTETAETIQQVRYN